MQVTSNSYSKSMREQREDKPGGPNLDLSESSDRAWTSVNSNRQSKQV